MITQLTTQSPLQNFSYLIEHQKGKFWCIDPFDAEQITKEVHARGGDLEVILNTHEHWDHYEGNEALQYEWKCEVWSHPGAQGIIKNIDRFLKSGETLMEDSFLQHSFIKALLGGGLIGMATSLMLYFDGKVAGISGILNGLLNGLIERRKGDILWRLAFLWGLMSGAIYLMVFNPRALSLTLERPTWALIVAGFLVGFGTTMGNGCTSGHGVCSVSRLSPRSIVATILFVAFGMLSATLFTHYFFGASNGL